jgi:hypothetical protein
MKVTAYNKALVAVATALANAVALGLLDGDAAGWATVVLASLGAIGVYAVPNKTPAAPAPAKRAAKKRGG